jgi:hypothetical protein
MGTPVFVYDRVAVDESQVANALPFRPESYRKFGGGFGESSRKAMQRMFVIYRHIYT